MGNLGGYQRMTTVAKALGGPGSAVTLLLGAGVVLGGAIVAGGGKIVRVAKRAAHQAATTRSMATGQFYVITSDAEGGGGLTVRGGDRFRVLNSDGDAILIELLDDPHSPYFVSAAFLRSVSEFPSEHDDTGS